MRKVRSGIGHMQLRRTPLDFPLLVFFLTLFMGIWLSYSARLALNKFWVMVVALLVYYAITAVPRRYAWWIAAACAPLAVGFTIFFVTAPLWHLGLLFLGGFFPPLYRFISLEMFWPLLLPHANVVAGHIAMLLPYALAVLLYARREKYGKLSLGAAVCLFISLIGLALTRSVGAWLALAAGAAMWGLWPISDWLSVYLSLPRRLLYGLLLVVIAVIGVITAWQIVNQGWPGTQTLTERITLIVGSWRLVQDYSWMGSGLASFPALYAEYVQVVPNFFLHYSNFYLDVLLELGLVGAMSVLAVWVGALWQVVGALRRSLARPYPQNSDMYWLRWATLSSLVIILVHGLMDNSLFGGLGSPLLFFTPAMAVLVSRLKPEVELLFFNRRIIWFTAVILLMLSMFLLAFRQRTMADWHAYQGVWLMDHAVLPGWPRNEWRHGNFTNLLAPARHHFETALALDNNNRTAHQRLGMIALWEQDIETAVFHLQQAYTQDPAHRGVIKSLGYAYVWQGQPAQAFALLSQIPEAVLELEAYSAVWHDLNQPVLAERAAAMVAMLKTAP